MKDSFSPEEKLLRLIKSPKKEGVREEQKITPPAAETKPSEKPPVPFYFSMKSFLPRIETRKIIGGFFAASCLFLVVSLLWPWLGLKKTDMTQIKQERIADSIAETKKQTKPFSFYQDAVKGRAIFGASAQDSEKPASAVNLDINKDINLVGIITGDNPQAVIEDKKTNRTYYISKGQFIGDIRIQDIREGKIIIEYRGQQFELYL